MTDAVDLNALRSLKDIIGGNPADLRELVNDFITELPVQVQRMHDQTADGDLKGLRITAHSCKSNARDLGALPLSLLCAELENAAASGGSQAGPALLTRISLAADTVLSSFAALDLADV